MHETALSAALWNGVVLGVGMLDHLRPFQRSTSAWESENWFGVSAPTAIQRVDDVHDTPLRTDITGGATGASCTVQSLPFHPIASAAVPFCPTAMQ